MQFENKEQHRAYVAYLRLFGLHGSSWHITKQEKNNRNNFFRKCSLSQATLKGFELAVTKRYASIHGRGLTVDHIVPLYGVDKENNHIVCGLNVPWNLRGETAEKNHKKGNLFVDSPDAIGIILSSKRNNV